MDRSRTTLPRPALGAAAALLLVGLVPYPPDARAQSVGSPELENFGALVVGEWEADDSRHVFEWGVGRRLLRSRSYFPAAEGWRLVSEGMWWWDEGVQAVRGLTFATGMPVSRFDYVTRAEGSRVVHAVEAVGPEGLLELRETWEFGDGSYTWVLESRGESGWEEWMSGRYRRISDEDPGRL
jgi:hypothetical protein